MQSTIVVTFCFLRDVLEKIDAIIHENICHPDVVYKPSLASTSQIIKPAISYGDEHFRRYTDKCTAKKHHRSSIKKFQTNVKKCHTQTLI